MDSKKRENLLQAMFLIQEALKTPEPSPNGLPEKQERRIESDSMSSTPISDEIIIDLSGCARSRVVECGGEVNCVVIGERTGLMASVISDQFSGAGGRVICIGDCVDSDGNIIKDWLEHVGDRWAKTVFPAVGDTFESFRDFENPFDLVLLNTCGKYSEMASLISRWYGLLNPGGVICGTQHDYENYAASLNAVHEVIGKDRVNSTGSEFWWATTNKQVEASS